jgi:hypothetical protein
MKFSVTNQVQVVISIAQNIYCKCSHNEGFINHHFFRLPQQTFALFSFRMSESYDPTALCCAWCYVCGELKHECANCPRRYCGKDCQRNDLMAGHLKFGCEKAGEQGSDYEIRCAGDKGLGLFALRNFQRGEKILVERSVMTRNADNTFTKDALNDLRVLKATLSLAPKSQMDIMAKFQTNSIALSGNEEADGGSGLFIHFSRVNHDCIGNSSHYYDPELAQKLLVADHNIEAGSEITFSYASMCSSKERAMRLRLRGFECNCQACKNPSIADKLDRMRELDGKILTLGGVGKTESAIQAGKSLLKLYDEMQSSDILYSRTHYDLFSMCITKRKTLKLGIAHLKRARECALRFYGRENHGTVQEYQHLINDPSRHHNYLVLG